MRLLRPLLFLATVAVVTGAVTVLGGFAIGRTPSGRAADAAFRSTAVAARLADLKTELGGSGATLLSLRLDRRGVLTPENGADGDAFLLWRVRPYAVARLVAAARRTNPDLAFEGATLRLDHLSRRLEWSVAMVDPRGPAFGLDVVGSAVGRPRCLRVVAAGDPRPRRAGLRSCSA
jgi:hypothetical protein